MLKKYTYIFFDIDGVLLSSVYHYALLFKEVAENLGANNDIPISFYSRMLGTPAKEALASIVPKNNHNKIQQIFDSLRIEKDTAQNVLCVEGSNELLKNLKDEGKKIALISSKSKPGVSFVIEKFNWGEYIDFSISGDEVSKWKPDPEGILKSINFFKAKNNQVVFIGDSLHDLKASKNAGIDFIGVLTGVCNEDDWGKEGVRYVDSVKSFIIDDSN